MGTGLHDISAVRLGERLRVARETASLTQQAAADATGIGRTTLVAIEREQRRIRLSELQRLAKAYNVSINSLLRLEAVHVDLVPRFRSLPDAHYSGTLRAAHLMNSLVRAETELEAILGVSRVRDYPAERPILSGDVRAQAEEDAQYLRMWLGLGEAPVRDVLGIIEHQLAVRVFARPLDDEVSGLFAYDPAVGGCMLFNSLHRLDRRNQTAAHELGHFMGTRQSPEVYRDAAKANSREERYAQAFGRAFLTPSRAVRQRFNEVTMGARHLTRRHVIILADHFGVSRQALVMRLEELGLAKKGAWDWFSDNGGITDAQARQVLGEDREPLVGELPPRSLHLHLLAITALKQGLISEGQMADMLALSRLEVRALIDEAATDQEEVDDVFKLPE